MQASTPPVVNGIILVLKCEKYRHTPSRNIKYNAAYFESIGWPIVYVYGNPNLAEEYTWEAAAHHMVVRSPDTYLHLIVKLAIAYRALMKIYSIKHGIFRIGDKYHINDIPAAKFLLGLGGGGVDYTGFYPIPYPATQDLKFHSTHMRGHVVDDERYYNFIQVPYAVGIAFYLSVRACEVIAATVLDTCKGDVYHEMEGVYPLTIEDYGVGFILNRAGIPLVNNAKVCKRIPRKSFDTPAYVRGYIGYRIYFGTQ